MSKMTVRTGISGRPENSEGLHTKKRPTRTITTSRGGTPMKAGSTSSIDAGEAIVGAPLPNRPSDCIATMPTTPPATNVVVLGFIMANVAVNPERAFPRAIGLNGLLGFRTTKIGWQQPDVRQPREEAGGRQYT